MNQPPLVRQHYPSVDEARATIKAHNDGTQPLEPYQLISQYTLEPLLKQEVETLPSVTMRYGCEFLSFEQNQAGVSMTRVEIVALEVGAGSGERVAIGRVQDELANDGEILVGCGRLRARRERHARHDHERTRPPPNAVHVSTLREKPGIIPVVEQTARR